MGVKIELQLWSWTHGELYSKTLDRYGLKLQYKDIIRPIASLGSH